LPSQLFNRVRPAIEKIKLPPGYSLEWGGEYEDSRDARAALAKPLPLAVVLMVLIVVWIFNSTRATLVICLTVPLAIIGVTAGLLLTGQAFGFMALLGAIALAGEQIKNSIVLVDEFATQRFDLGKPTYEAIVTGSVSRLRPVMLVAVTTVLGTLTAGPPWLRLTSPSMNGTSSSSGRLAIHRLSQDLGKVDTPLGCGTWTHGKSWG
jgi:multidrug efflux pump subunit AcrB